VEGRKEKALRYQPPDPKETTVRILIKEEAQAVIDAEDAFDEAMEDEDDDRTPLQIVEEIVLNSIEEDTLSVVEDGEELRMVVFRSCCCPFCLVTVKIELFLAVSLFLS